MCVRTAVKASALCSLPGFAGFAAGLLAVERPKWFLALLVATLGMIGFTVIRSMVRSSPDAGGAGMLAGDLAPNQVAAGALLAISFLFSFWCGIAWAAGLGLVKPGLFVAAATALMAAFVLTFVRRWLAGEVTWAPRLRGILR